MQILIFHLKHQNVYMKKYWNFAQCKHKYDVLILCKTISCHVCKVTFHFTCTFLASFRKLRIYNKRECNWKNSYLKVRAIIALFMPRYCNDTTIVWERYCYMLQIGLYKRSIIEYPQNRLHKYRWIYLKRQKNILLSCNKRIY